jgi:hypothetical protein
MEYIGSNWVQAGELGLAFVVMILCSGLVLFVLKTSNTREKNYLDMIAKFLPLIENISNSMDSVNANMGMISNRLENIENGQTVFMTRNECKILRFSLKYRHGLSTLFDINIMQPQPP